MLQIELLCRQHDRTGFDCGEAALNDYLKWTAHQHIEKGISRTFVLVETDDPNNILGYFTLASCEVVTSDLPENYAKKYPARAPAAKLARLAVSTGLQRRGLGAIMMAEAMRRTLAVVENIGIICFFVDAKNQTARQYYEQFGFMALPDNPLVMFLPIHSLKAAMDAARNK